MAFRCPVVSLLLIPRAVGIEKPTGGSKMSAVPGAFCSPWNISTDSVPYRKMTFKVVNCVGLLEQPRRFGKSPPEAFASFELDIFGADDVPLLGSTVAETSTNPKWDHDCEYMVPTCATRLKLILEVLDGSGRRGMFNFLKSGTSKLLGNITEDIHIPGTDVHDAGHLLTRTMAVPEGESRGQDPPTLTMFIQFGDVKVGEVSKVEAKDKHTEQHSGQGLLLVCIAGAAVAGLLCLCGWSNLYTVTHGPVVEKITRADPRTLQPVQQELQKLPVQRFTPSRSSTSPELGVEREVSGRVHSGVREKDRGSSISFQPVRTRKVPSPRPTPLRPSVAGAMSPRIGPADSAMSPSAAFSNAPSPRIGPADSAMSPSAAFSNAPSFKWLANRGHWDDLSRQPSAATSSNASGELVGGARS